MTKIHFCLPQSKLPWMETQLFFWWEVSGILRRYPEVGTVERRAPCFLNQNSEIAFRSGAILKHPDRTGRGDTRLHPLRTVSALGNVKAGPWSFLSSAHT